MLDALNTDPQERYPEPLHPLLTYGDPSTFGDALLDEQHAKLSADLIPDLIRMTADRALWKSEPNSELLWAPTHAALVLARLQALEAIVPLIRMTRWITAHDLSWCEWELPDLLVRFGSGAIPVLADFVSDKLRPAVDRLAVFEAMMMIACVDSACRAEVVRLLTDELRESALGDPLDNGMIVHLLVSLQARESAEVIERAFAANHVVAPGAATWGEVRRRLGVEGAGLAQDDAGRPLTSYWDDRENGALPFTRHAQKRPDFQAVSDNRKREKRKRQRAIKRRHRR